MSPLADMASEPTESAKVVNLLFLAVFMSSLSLMVFSSFTIDYRYELFIYPAWKTLFPGYHVSMLKNLQPVVFLGIACSRLQNLRRVNSSLNFLPQLPHLPHPRSGPGLSSILSYFPFRESDWSHILSFILRMFHHLSFLCCILYICSSVSFSLLTLSKVVPNFLFKASIEIVILFIFS